jgi:hypothetical protein
LSEDKTEITKAEREERNVYSQFEVEEAIKQRRRCLSKSKKMGMKKRDFARGGEEFMYSIGSWGSGDRKLRIIVSDEMWIASNALAERIG